MKKIIEAAEEFLKTQSPCVVEAYEREAKELQNKLKSKEKTYYSDAEFAMLGLQLFLRNAEKFIQLEELNNNVRKVVQEAEQLLSELKNRK